MAETVILFLTGLVGGGFGSLVGLGGAVIMLPVVQMVLHYRPDMAVGTTLFAVIFTSLSSSWGALPCRQHTAENGNVRGGRRYIGNIHRFLCI